MIAEIQVLPTPAGTTEDSYAHVDAAIAMIEQSGVRYEVGPLGTSFEGAPSEVWRVLRAAHEATIAAGARSVVTVVKLAEGAGDDGPAIDDLVGKFRP
jgi:uncharacterized protein YqgV (UPF0045/DUF77 family)